MWQVLLSADSVMKNPGQWSWLQNLAYLLVIGGTVLVTVLVMWVVMKLRGNRPEFQLGATKNTEIRLIFEETLSAADRAIVRDRRVPAQRPCFDRPAGTMARKTPRMGRAGSLPRNSGENPGRRNPGRTRNRRIPTLRTQPRPGTGSRPTHLAARRATVPRHRSEPSPPGNRRHQIRRHPPSSTRA